MNKHFYVNSTNEQAFRNRASCICVPADCTYVEHQQQKEEQEKRLLDKRLALMPRLEVLKEKAPYRDAEMRGRGTEDIAKRTKSSSTLEGR